MARLLVKFEAAVLLEVPVGTLPINIGRAPDNEIFIDNLGVSNYHARVYPDSGRLMLEDLDSLNGTFLNNSRVKKEWLRSGDNILVGKHVIVFDQEHDAEPTLGMGRRVPAPKVDETYVLNSAQRSELAQQLDKSEVTASARARVPSLIVLRGRTNQKDYLLSSKLTIIGKSPMATIRLRGWFAPQVAAQINKNQSGYYLGITRRTPKVNGVAVKPPVLLNDGDLIDIGGVLLKFMYRD